MNQWRDLYRCGRSGADRKIDLYQAIYGADGASGDCG